MNGQLIMMVANYTENDGSQLPYCPLYKPRLSGANIPYMDNEGGKLYGYGRWPTIGIMKVANYTDNEGGQLYGYGRWPTIRIWKVANYTDIAGNEGGQL